MDTIGFEVNLRFNPRSRTGSDITKEALIEEYRGFNPRSRTGSDPELYNCEKNY